MDVFLDYLKVNFATVARPTEPKPECGFCGTTFAEASQLEEVRFPSSPSGESSRLRVAPPRPVRPL